MGKIDYRLIKKRVLLKIKGIRNEYAITEERDLGESNEAINSKILDFTADNHTSYEFVNASVKKCIYEQLESILLTLFTDAGVQVSNSIKLNTQGDMKNMPLMTMFNIYKSAPAFVMVKIENNEPVMYCFKEFGLDQRMPENVMSDLIGKLGIKNYHYISLVEESAYTEILNHNEDLSDRSRGTNAYSFKDFFVSNFGDEEYAEFKLFIDSLTGEIKNYLGFSIVKTLTPNALFSFKKTVEKEILNYKYGASVSGTNGITVAQLDTLKKQYFGEKFYKALTSEGDFNNRFNIDGCQFAESFITSEWLYQSLPNVGKIDLTAIAMGYFKAIEELLFVFVTAHADEGKWIDTYDRPDQWQAIQLRDRKWQVPVNARSMKNKKRFIMIKRMINFLNDYDDLFNDITLRSYLVERLHNAQQLRNGYFHKDNLSEMEIVIKARDDAFVIFMLLFGSMKISNEGKQILGIPIGEVQFDMLSDYINYHCHMSYYYGDENCLTTAIGQADNKVEYDENGKASFTGIYFNRLVNFPSDKKILSLQDMCTIQKEKVHFDSETVPVKIYKGTFTTCAEGINISGPQKLIWENGKFFGDIIDKEQCT